MENHWGERAVKDQMQIVRLGVTFTRAKRPKHLLETKNTVSKLSFEIFFLVFIAKNPPTAYLLFLMPRQADKVLQCDDFLGWTVSSLKDFLLLRRLKQMGKKSELVAWANLSAEKRGLLTSAILQWHQD